MTAADHDTDTVGGNLSKLNVNECCGSCRCDLKCGKDFSCCFGQDEITTHDKMAKNALILFSETDMVSEIDNCYYVCYIHVLPNSKLIMQVQRGTP